MNIRNHSIAAVSALLCLIDAALLGARPVRADGQTPCVPPASLVAASNLFVETKSDGDYICVTITNISQQKVKVGLAIYKVCGCVPIRCDNNFGGLKQRLFDVDTLELEPGKWTVLCVKIPKCRWQVDAFVGDVLKCFPSGDNYGVCDSDPCNDRFLIGVATDCEKPTPINGTQVFPPTPSCMDCDCDEKNKGGTRTQGYYKNHQPARQAALANCGPFTLGPVTIATDCQAYDILWSNVAKLSDGTHRSELGKARIKLAHQLLTAQFNVCLFGLDPNSGVRTLINQANAALAGTDIALINSLQGQLDVYNNSGDGIAFPGNAQYDNAKGAGCTPDTADGVFFR